MYRILPHFTASPVQVTAYLGGIALFSISFLVFLNASISFVITDVLGRRKAVGSAVGTLGFADELVALVACPLWGLISDRIGVRWVAVAGYFVIGLSLICLVQSAHVYPDLVIWRMVFSVGAAACTTMVTAILPAMTAPRARSAADTDGQNGANAIPNGASSQASGANPNRNSLVPSVSSDLTITPARFESRRKSAPLLARYRHSRRRSIAQAEAASPRIDPPMDASRLAGFVGMFTGIGALIAVGVFLPLPTMLGKNVPKAQAVQNSFYIVGAIALCVAVLVGVGLRRLPGEEGKGFRHLLHYGVPSEDRFNRSEEASSTGKVRSGLTYWDLVKYAVTLGFTDSNIALGYVGGFVARASSVGVSSFIPLFVNAYFIREGLCTDDPGDELKKSCEAAYKLASMLTGISQLVALLAAPLYGFFNARFAHQRHLSRIPLALAAVAGIIGYAIFGHLQSPDPKTPSGKPAIVAVILIGISQIGAIVCSLGILARGIHTPDAILSSGVATQAVEEAAPLLPQEGATPTAIDRARLKGSIAGIYSLAGGAAILLLTKLGGHLFDVADPGAPFYLLAGFNAVLLVAIGMISAGGVVSSKKRDVEVDVDDDTTTSDER